MARGLFQVSALGEARWLLKDQNFNGKAGIEQVSDRMSVPRQNFALASIMEKFVFVTGGLVTGGDEGEVEGQTPSTTSTGRNSERILPVCGLTERYDVANRVWETTSELIVPRQGHSSCAIDDTVYVFCGCDHKGNMLFSIEKLCCAGKANLDRPRSPEGPARPDGNQSMMSEQSEWQLLQLRNVDTNGSSSCFPRILPSVSFLNVDEVCIMGGQGQEGPLGDVILFNVQTEEVKTVVGNFAGLLTFSGTGRG